MIKNGKNGILGVQPPVHPLTLKKREQKLQHTYSYCQAINNGVKKDTAHIQKQSGVIRRTNSHLKISINLKSYEPFI